MKQEKPKSNTEQILNKFGESCGDTVDNVVGYLFAGVIFIMVVVVPITGLIYMIFK